MNNYTSDKPSILFYNISKLTINISNICTINKISFNVISTNYIGLQRIDVDEESKTLIIDDAIYYIPLNTEFLKSFNNIYLKRNEIYIENENNIITYTQILNKKTSTILTNPYNTEYPIKTLIEFNNTKGVFPYNFASIIVGDINEYNIKILLFKNNDIILDENLNIHLNTMYDLAFQIICKKGDKLELRIVNLTNMTNIKINMFDLHFK